MWFKQAFQIHYMNLNTCADCVRIHWCTPLSFVGMDPHKYFLLSVGLFPDSNASLPHNNLMVGLSLGSGNHVRSFLLHSEKKTFYVGFSYIKVQFQGWPHFFFNPAIFSSQLTFLLLIIFWRTDLPMVLPPCTYLSTTCVYPTVWKFPGCLSFENSLKMYFASFFNGLFTLKALATLYWLIFFIL